MSAEQAASTDGFRVYLSAAMFEAFLEPVRSAVPGAQVIPLEPDGTPQGTDWQQAEGPAALLVSYDLFLAFRDNPAIGDNLCRLAERCTWVQGGSAGTDDALLLAVRAVSKRYCNAAGVHAVPIAQYVFAQLLRWYRRLDTYAEHQRERRWNPFLVDCELTGKTLGVLGYGGIGREIGRLGKAFQMRVLGWRRNPEPDPGADEVLAGADGLKRVLSESDCLAICLPQSPETLKLLDVERIGWMKPGVVLVNVGRGAVVDEAALNEALRDGQIAFAGLDVLTEEPPPQDSPLWDAPNCQITPHVSAWSPLAAIRLRDLFCDNLQRWAQNRPLHNEETS